MSAVPLRILHVLYSLEPGGLENGVVNVARLLRLDEFQVHVCCLERSGAFAERLPDPNLVYVLDKQPGFSLRTVMGLARIIAQKRPHVVHSHNLGALIYSSLATGMGRWRPILHGEHGQLQGEQLEPRRMRQRRWLYHCCRKVHTVSRHLREHLIQLGLPPSRITVVVNGVDTERFAPGEREQARRSLGLPVSGPMLGIVGRLASNKRHAVLFDAFSRLSRDLPNAQLLVVGGGGPEADSILQQARTCDAHRRIHLAGFQSNPVPFYQAMDLLVAPSLYEGLSNVLLEAMACGVPALSHTACGNSEAIRHGVDGFVADIDTPDRLYAQIRRILARPESLAAIGQRARESALERFSIAGMVRHYERLYLEVASRATGSAG